MLLSQGKAWTCNEEVFKRIKYSLDNDLKFEIFISIFVEKFSIDDRGNKSMERQKSEELD